MREGHPGVGHLPAVELARTQRLVCDDNTLKIISWQWVESLLTPLTPYSLWLEWNALGQNERDLVLLEWFTILLLLFHLACLLSSSKERSWYQQTRTHFLSYHSWLKCSTTFSFHFPLWAMKWKTLFTSRRSHCWDGHVGIDTCKLMAFLMYLKAENSIFFPCSLKFWWRPIGFESPEHFSWAHSGFPQKKEKKKKGKFGTERLYKSCIVRQDQAAPPFQWSKQETALIVGVGRGGRSKWRTTGSLCDLCTLAFPIFLHSLSAFNHNMRAQMNCDWQQIQKGAIAQ